ncbi:MAG: Zn-ribbon domain-containing OB-fold protein [Archaeoglobaceae archaeon]|nr:Zn-ribbon domain-containing OB-fold protein [Archaeoglobaceae archaeon]MDW8117757.1 Zn-ribbon domain-containing OB-fold protein [Archaeoglobaceae archaeon]
MFAEFFNNLKEGKLLGLKCRDCGTITCPPKNTCNKCSSRNLEKIVLSGKGAIRSYTVTYIAPMGYEKEAPYTVALVELEEGPWIVGRLDVEDKLVEKEDFIGKRVSVFAREMQSEMFYPDKNRRIIPYFKVEG